MLELSLSRTVAPARFSALCLIVHRSRLDLTVHSRLGTYLAATANAAWLLKLALQMFYANAVGSGRTASAELETSVGHPRISGGSENVIFGVDGPKSIAAVA